MLREQLFKVVSVCCSQKNTVEIQGWPLNLKMLRKNSKRFGTEQIELEFVVPCLDECNAYVTAAMNLWQVLLTACACLQYNRVFVSQFKRRLGRVVQSPIKLTRD